MSISLNLSRDAFEDLIGQVVEHAWAGDVQINVGHSSLVATVNSPAAPQVIIGTWLLLPIPGPMQVDKWSASSWAVNRALREIRDVTGTFDLSDYSGPGVVIVPASAELAAFITDQSLETALRGLGSTNLPTSVLKVRVLAPQVIESAADGLPQVKRAFLSAGTDPAGLTSLAESATSNLRRGARSAISSAMRRFVQTSETDISLTQAGGAGDDTVALASIFFDLSASPWPDEGEDTVLGVCAEIVRSVDMPLLAHSQHGRAVRTVLVGGPGQGKSTAMQFLTQLYRARFLEVATGRSPRVDETLSRILARAHRAGIPDPSFRRWPIHVSLARYAEYFAKRRPSTVSGIGQEQSESTVEGLLAYIVRKEPAFEDAPLKAAEMRAWLREWPTLLILDGMDETPPSLREEILAQIDDFEEVAFQLGADVAIVATTRPQSSSTDFPFERWDHLKLRALTPAEGKGYAKEIVQIHHDVDSDDGAELLARAEVAIDSPQTSRLARSPLQITILVLLFRENIRAQSRFQLFDGYYSVVFRREANKPGELGEFVRNHEQVLAEVHERAAFVMQSNSEYGEDGTLTNDQLKNLLEKVLEIRGYAISPVFAERLRFSIIDRLVLLVSPREGSWHFEVRVLQEYMVARHWSSGQTFDLDEVTSLLTRTLRLQFWRTVWSLCASRILSDRPMYRPSLLAILSEANTSDPLAVSTKPGSRIAVDLLLDDVAYNRPNDARMLLQLALDNLQDLQLDSISALADVIVNAIQTDPSADQLFSDFVVGTGSEWSLRRVALTALLRAMRVRISRDTVQSRIDRWLKLIENQNDAPRFVNQLEEATLQQILSSTVADLKPPQMEVATTYRFSLVNDVEGSGRALDDARDVSSSLSSAIGRLDSNAIWIAFAESQLRDSDPRLAKQFRDALAYWIGSTPSALNVQADGTLSPAPLL